MYTALIFLHVLVSLALILIVLLQTGKGAALGAMFGGGSNQTIFGSRGAATFLSKLTTAAAIIFMLTSLSLSMLYSRAPRTSVIQPEASEAGPAPLAPPLTESRPTPGAPAGQTGAPPGAPTGAPAPEPQK